MRTCRENASITRHPIEMTQCRSASHHSPAKLVRTNLRFNMKSLHVGIAFQSVVTSTSGGNLCKTEDGKSIQDEKTGQVELAVTAPRCDRRLASSDHAPQCYDATVHCAKLTPHGESCLLSPQHVPGRLDIHPLKRPCKTKANRSSVPLELLLLLFYIVFVYWIPVFRRNATVAAMLLVGAAIAGTAALLRNEQTGTNHVAFPHPAVHAAFSQNVEHEANLSR
jgi:hypothetical protein